MVAIASHRVGRHCRRFLPTVANVFHFDRESSQALGSWVEDVSGTSSTAMPEHMSVHYSDQRALSSGMVKMKAVTELFAALDHIPDAKAILDGGSKLLPAGSISWELVAGIHRDHIAKEPKEKQQKKNKHKRKHDDNDPKEQKRKNKTKHKKAKKS